MSGLSAILGESRTACYAWASIPNHFHLLLKTGQTPIATLMRRLLTGYAVSFNLRHRRSGHLFLNRYKSILCQEDAYLLELVRYIHLNPLRAKIVADLKGLDGYGYGGHSVLIGRCRAYWQDTDYVLRLFGGSPRQARKRYREFVQKENAMMSQTDFSGLGHMATADETRVGNRMVGRPEGPGPDPAGQWGIYVIDRWGNREILYADPAIGSMCPIPLRPRPRPPVPASDTRADAPARVFVTDVYEGLGARRCSAAP